jgi:hypothetical protein
MLPFVLAAGAIAGAGLSAMQTSKQNKYLKESAKNQMQSVNEELNQARLANYDASAMLYKNAQTRIGQFINSLGGKSGQSVRLALAEVSRDAASDQINLNQDIAYKEKAAMINKQNISTGAQSQMQSVGLSALQGGIQGATTAASLYSSISSFNKANELNKALSNPDLTPAQSNALLSGVPVSQLNNPAVLAYYNNQQQLQNLAVQSATAERNAAFARFGRALFGR